MKDRIITSSLRQIKSSYKRFLSLVLMSGLGVSVFVGIKSTAPGMIKTLDDYYDERDVYDIKVSSFLGLDEKDILAIDKLGHTKKSVGSNYRDAIVHNADKSFVIRANGIYDNMNSIKLKAGRMPKNEKEILVEENLLERENLKIGDDITIDNWDDEENVSFKIVGTVESPLYFHNANTSVNRGMTNIGTGVISYYTYVLNEAFGGKYYTDIYLKIDGGTEEITSSKKYLKLVDSSLKELESIKKSREDARYGELLQEIDDRASSIESEFEEKRAELDKGARRLEMARYTLDKNKGVLQNGKNELVEAENELEDAKNILTANKDMLDKSRNQLDEAKNKLDEASDEISESEKKIAQAEENLDTAKRQISESITPLTYEDLRNIKVFVLTFEIDKNDLLKYLPQSLKENERFMQHLDVFYENGAFHRISDYEEVGRDKLLYLIPDGEEYNELRNIVENIDFESLRKNIIDDILTTENLANIIDNLPEDSQLAKRLESLKGDIDNLKSLWDSIDVIEEKTRELNAGKEQLAAIQKEYDSKMTEYLAGEVAYSTGFKEYSDGENKYNARFNEYLVGLQNYENGKREYENGLRTYNDNLVLYRNGQHEYDLKYSEFQDEIRSLKDKLKDNYPKWLVKTRADASDYTGFIDNAESIANLAKLFPTIFLIVALFVSLISMSRMVEEDRIEIGTLKSLGFSDVKIGFKYLLYSGLATLIGGCLGAFIGFAFLPKFIWRLYRIAYDIDSFSYSYNLLYAFIGIFVSLICICGTTIWTLKSHLRENPAKLMRPITPSQGKKILLERFTPLWKRIKFSKKITIRNIFRYKSRIIMTTIGIMGCTILMISGFGIKSAITGVVDKQFKGIYHFDDMVYLNNVEANVATDILDNPHIESKLLTKMVGVSLQNINANIFVIGNDQDYSKIVELRNLKGDRLKLDESGVIITDKLSKMLKKNIGDILTFTDANDIEYSVKIAGITEHYVGHYIYMSENMYRNYNNFTVNVALVSLDSMVYENVVNREILKNSEALSITSIEKTTENVERMMKSLNGVVAILIILSTMLTFIVLYNLSYINISERKREIATLKVLGFYPKEVDNYINRENIIITLFGIVLGLLIGKQFTSLIIDIVEVRSIRFIRTMDFSNYALTFILMLIATWIVDFIIHYSLKHIDMISSLKNVE